MKIPEALDKLSAMFGRMSKEMAQDTKKLSAMQAELQGAKGHLKNMGLLFMGKAAKEAEHSKSDKGVLSRLSRLFEKRRKDLRLWSKRRWIRRISSESPV